MEATLDPGSATEVSWSMRDSAPIAAARDVRALADVLTLITLGDSDVRMAALIDLIVVQGEPRTIDVRLPSGYELTGISGTSLEGREQRDRDIIVTIADPTARRHQFLVSLERQHEGGSFTLDTGMVTLPKVQRERGEIAIEGTGTIELNAVERVGIHRIDVRELNPALHSLARLPIVSGFRYQLTAAPPDLTLDVKRFAETGVLAAMADRATATTLVTTEGRALTEVALTVRNRAQPFLKITLPAGASVVSVDVAGQPAKPVLGGDGTRIPLLRPGFRPIGPYQVTFVYLHAGTPFARKGEMQMTLPRMDMPVGLVEWEVFVPDTYSARAIGGNVIDRRAMEIRGLSGQPLGPRASVSGRAYISAMAGAVPGQIRVRATDGGGAVLPGVAIELQTGSSHQTATTGADGTFLFSGVSSGSITITAGLAGFISESRSFLFDQGPKQVDFVLDIETDQEAVTVSSASPEADERPGARDAQKSTEPSQNVVNLQRRATGVLPIRVEVPRSGTSHQFVKPLVVDQETVVSFRYKRR